MKNIKVIFGIISIIYAYYLSINLPDFMVDQPILLLMLWGFIFIMPFFVILIFAKEDDK